MKTHFLLSASLCFFIVLLSCEKNVSAPVDPSNPIEDVLTEKTWKYNEYFTNFSSVSAKVTFKIGKPNNQSDYGQNRVKFKLDKTYTEITQNGDTLKGTWKLLNNNTQLEVKNLTGTFLSTIIFLNSNSFIWNDEQRNIYARMLPEDFDATPSIDINKLTGKKWKYLEYFVDFALTKTALAFKIDKQNNFLDLSKNRVLFNSDGSVSEIDENGNSIPGSWKFINGGPVTGIKVNNYAGVFQSALIHLDDSSFVWYDLLNNRYAKMVVAKNETSAGVISTRTNLLCNKNWLYHEYFSNYNLPVAELSYKRDKATANTLNLTANRASFNQDGTYTEITANGATINGTWQFLENETKLKTVYSSGTNTSEIVQLDSTSFVWYDTTVKTYGKMRISSASQYTVNTSSLAGKSWIYYEYFKDYKTIQSSLVYKRERAFNNFNLGANMVVFNTDGSFNEVNENGLSFSGTWQILNGNKLYTNSVVGGANTATLIMLDNKNLIWHNETTDTYGKMVVKP